MVANLFVSLLFFSHTLAIVCCLGARNTPVPFQVILFSITFKNLFNSMKWINQDLDGIAINIQISEHSQKVKPFTL